MNEQKKQETKSTGVTPGARKTSDWPVGLYLSKRPPQFLREQARAGVLRAYNERCCTCGRTIASERESSKPDGPGVWATPSIEANWHAHHRLPVSMGGGRARYPHEFLLLCQDCHALETERERRSFVLGRYLFRARSILRAFQGARFSRSRLQQSTGINRDSFSKTLRWLYRTQCIAGDAKSIGLTRQGEVSLRLLNLHGRLTRRERCVSARQVVWFDNGLWHPWLRTHLALLIATECQLLPPVTNAIALPCGETTLDPESDIRFASHLIEQMAAIGERHQTLPTLNVALLARLSNELYALEEWCIGEIRPQRRSLAHSSQDGGAATPTSTSDFPLTREAGA